MILPQYVLLCSALTLITTTSAFTSPRSASFVTSRQFRLVTETAIAAESDESESSSASSKEGEEGEKGEDEVSRQLAKARELIERTKEKIEKREAAAQKSAKEEEEADVKALDDFSSDEGEEKEDDKDAAEEEDEEVLPFFAQKGVDTAEIEKRRELITKTKDDETGLITTDGEKMASLAEEEKWESRGLYDLFKNEVEQDEEALRKEARASRDVAAAMMNLRMRMNKDDFEAIFDKKNRFIGEE